MVGSEGFEPSITSARGSVETFSNGFAVSKGLSKEIDAVELLTKYEEFARVDLRLEPSTIKNHQYKLRPFLNWLGDKPLTKEVLRAYLGLHTNDSSYQYSNILKAGEIP